jgi:F-type H+-transporting ATPase subunit epsilon
VAENHHTLRCVVVTPERVLLDEAVDFVALPLYDGELGVLPGRAALIGRLGPGELRVRDGGQVRRFFVDGGFAQVRGDVVTVLTPRALKAEDIDTAAASACLGAAHGQRPTAEAQLRAVPSFVLRRDSLHPLRGRREPPWLKSPSTANG